MAEKQLTEDVTDGGNKELVSRVTDSAGTQINPMNQDALDGIANDEIRSLLMATDTGASDVKVIGEQLDTNVANTDVAVLTWLSRALNGVGIDELVSRVTDSTGTQVNPATSDGQPNYFDDSVNGYDLIGSGDYSIGETNVKGTSEVSIKFNSADGANFTVTIDWTDGSGNVLYTEDPAGLTGVSDANETVVVGSDYFQLTITDTSGGGQNIISGTVNFH